MPSSWRTLKALQIGLTTGPPRLGRHVFALRGHGQSLRSAQGAGVASRLQKRRDVRSCKSAASWPPAFKDVKDIDIWPGMASRREVLPHGDGLVHLDRSPPTLTVRGLLQTWADWWTLAFDVDGLVLSQSGFGATALEIGPVRPAFLGSHCVPADGSTGRRFLESRVSVSLRLNMDENR